MTRAEYAEYRRVEANTVTKWKARGFLVLVADPERPGKTLVDADATDAVLDRNVDQTAGRPKNADVAGDEVEAKDAPPSDYEISRLALAKARTQKLEIENARSLGNLVRLDDYSQKIETLGRLIRERMYSVIRQNAEWLASEKDPNKIRRTLLNDVDETFEQVAKEIEDMAGEEARADEVLADAEESAEEDDESG